MTPDTAGRSCSICLAGQDRLRPRRPAQQQESPFGRDWREAFVAFRRPAALGTARGPAARMPGDFACRGGGQTRRGSMSLGWARRAGGASCCAAASGGLIKKVTLYRSLVSWSNVIQNGLSRDQLGGVLPGVLEVYDLPDLAARLAPSAAFHPRPGRRRWRAGSREGASREIYAVEHEGLRPRKVQARVCGPDSRHHVPSRWRRRMNLSWSMVPPSSG